MQNFPFKFNFVTLKTFPLGKFSLPELAFDLWDAKS